MPNKGIDPGLLSYYKEELDYLRDLSKEFAEQYPDIARGLGLNSVPVDDPWVERLLEGVGFLTARVRLKLDSEFPRFTEALLNQVYPDYLAPLPSMAIVQFTPDPTQGDVVDGFTIERGATLKSAMSPTMQTPCRFTTAHDVTLWPIRVEAADYHGPDLGHLGVSEVAGGQAAIRLVVETEVQMPFSRVPMDKLCLYLRGGQSSVHLYEQLLGNATGVVVRSGSPSEKWSHFLEPSCIRPVGFEDDEALLACRVASFDSYRLLAEYFAFPARFRFVELTGLQEAARRCESNSLEIIVVLDRVESFLQRNVESDDFALHCTPAINLFSRKDDRVPLDPKQHEHHIVVDRTRPSDYEVHSVVAVRGIASGSSTPQEFHPFYAERLGGRDRAFYTAQRFPAGQPESVRSDKRRHSALSRALSSYGGSELFVSLVDGDQAPHRPDLKKLSVDTLCTNRHLTLLVDWDGEVAPFTLDTGAPVAEIQCVVTPTAPQPAFPVGETHWRLISHLSLNYLSILDTDGGEAARALQELLNLYGNTRDTRIERQIRSIQSVTSRPVVRRIGGAGPLAYGRGVEIRVLCEDAGLEGVGVFLLGAVLERFFAKQVSINSFTETVIETVQRGEVKRWPPRIGKRPLF